MYVLHKRADITYDTSKMTETTQKRLFVIDTDAGIDDAQAIFMALAANDVRVLAITTVQGNTSSGQVAKNVLRVLRVANRLDIPVYKGCDRTILGKKSVDSGYHGSDGFGDCLDDAPPSEELIKKEHAIDVLIQLSKDYKDEITLVCLGPLSNIAAVLQRDPEFGSRLKDCYIMGGNYYGRGNITVSSEYNFHCDPEAASAVLENLNGPITLVGWELCEDNGFPWEIYHSLRSSNSPECQFMKMIEQKPMEKCKELEWPTYLPADEVAMAVVLGYRDIVKETKRVYATVELCGKFTYGQVVVDWNNILKQKENVTLVTAINQTKYKQLLFKLIAKCDV